MVAAVSAEVCDRLLNSSLFEPSLIGFLLDFKKFLHLGGKREDSVDSVWRVIHSTNSKVLIAAKADVNRRYGCTAPAGSLYGTGFLEVAAERSLGVCGRVSL